MTEIKRVRDWRAKLSNVIEERRRKPFSVANNNCLHLVADGVLGMTGFDCAAQFRAEYQTAEEVLQAWHAAGYSDLGAVFAAHFEEIHPSQARAGDIMLFPSAWTGWTCGIVNGERVTVIGPPGLWTATRDIAK